MANFDRREAELLGHLNFLQCFREGTSWNRGGVTYEEGGVLLAIEGPHIMKNAAFRTDDRTAPDEVIRRADEFFAARGRGYALWVREETDNDLAQAAVRLGLVDVPEGRAPEMVCAQRLPAHPPPEGFEIRRVATVEDVAQFMEVNVAAYSTWGVPAKALRNSFAAFEPALNPHVVLVVAYVGSVPAAAALTFASHGIAGVYWVGTVDQHRRRGLGEAVVREVTNAGFDAGGRYNTLQASSMGEPIYKRLGYETLYYYRPFVRSRQSG